MLAGHRWLLAGAAAACISLVALAWGAPVAGAHAAFLESSPEPGVSLKRSPRQIALEFTEPLNRELTEIEIVSVATEEPLEVRMEFGGGGAVSVLPSRIPRGAFRVDWYTVSTLDGHPLEGSFGFGVRAPAASGAQSIEQSPLARQGWLRIGARALLYATLFLFAGGVLGAALLSRGRHPAAWLCPDRLAAANGGPAFDADAIRSGAWARTRRAGWLAASAALAVALVETLDATGGLSPGDVGDFLLANLAGISRLATPLTLLAALALAARRPAAAAAVGLALLSISFSGHANSAEPRSVAVLTDWTHLVGASVWVGGIAQVAAVWVPLARRVDRATRRTAMRAVLARFGRIALPAFLVVAASGLANALIQLGGPEALWETAYGRVLGLKIAGVGLIALASYWHALRIRPRVLAANPHPPKQERRHWRLLGTEPALATVVLIAAATLVVFPFPPRQLSELAESAVPECDPCPVPEPRSRELAVAEAAGSRIAALWLDSDGRGTLQLLDRDARPTEATARIEGGELLDPCGPGCWRIQLDAGTGRLSAVVEESGGPQRAALPSRWRPRSNARARRLLAKAQRTMRSLAAVRVRERTTSGPGISNVLSRVLRAERDRRVYRQAFRWSAFDGSARWLGSARVNGQRAVRVALLDPGSPVWYRLAIEPRSGRVLTERLITQAHFIGRRYSEFEAAG